MSTKPILACVAVCVCIVLIILLPMSISAVEINKFAFKINDHVKYIYPNEIYKQGRYWVWPGRYFVEYSKEVQTVLLCKDCKSFYGQLPEEYEHNYKEFPMIAAKTFEGINIDIYAYVEFTFEEPTDGKNVDDYVYMFYRRDEDQIMDLVGQYTRFYIAYFCQRFPINKFYESREVLNTEINSYIKKKLKQTLRINVTDVGLMNINIPQVIEETYEETKTKEQNFIMSVNEINVLIEQLKGDVRVAFINSEMIQEKAKIESSIIIKDGDVERDIIDSKVKQDQLTITQAISSLKLDQGQSNITYQGTSNSSVSQGDQVMGYWYTKNYTQDSGYKRLYAD